MPRLASFPLPGMAEAAQPRAARRSVAPDWLAVGSKIHLLYMKKKGKNKGDEVWYNAEVLKHRGGPNHKKGKDPPLEVLVNFDNGLIEEEEWFAEADWPTKLRDREWRRKEKVAELAARAEERKKEKEERKAEKDIKAVEKKKEQKEQKEQEALEEKERTRKKLEEPRESEVNSHPIGALDAALNTVLIARIGVGLVRSWTTTLARVPIGALPGTHFVPLISGDE